MFDLNQFIEDCKGKPASAVKELVRRSATRSGRRQDRVRCGISRVGISRKEVSPI